MSAILGNATSPDQIQELTLRARCFYLARQKSISIDFDAYKAHIASEASDSTTTQIPPREQVPSREGSIHHHHESDLPPASTTPSEQKTAPYPPTFAEIVAMITNNEPIPGIKDIPNIVLSDQGSVPKERKRRKPWEKDVDEETIQGGMGTFGDHRDKIIEQELPTDV